MRIFLILISITALISCSSMEKKDYQIPKKVIVAGKIDNINTKQLDVKLAVNRLGHGPLEVYTKADSLGNFHASFETYTPTDVWLSYKTNILILVHPGDSIYVRLNGNPNQRPEILKTIDFSGDAAKVNQDAAKFQLMYFSNPMYYDLDAKAKAVKEFDMDEYISYLDSIQGITDKLYNKFVTDVNPNKETKIWAKTYLDEDYYDALASYPADHLRANNLNNKEWSVPITYYDNLKKRLPISESMFISGFALTRFINRFHYFYVLNNLWEEPENQKYRLNNGYIAAPRNVTDSLIVFGIIKHTPDTLLKQMVLTELISQNFYNSDIKLFEKYQNVIESNIKESFLIESLLEKYKQIKERLENPQIASETMLKKIANSSANQIMDSIMSTNKGKVIYLDCWATWCAPCISEMPNSKELMKKMKGQDVAFVYMCLDSEEKLWKASLAELQLTGQHYFLTKEQSTDIRKVFEVDGIPHYFLIDKKGIIVEKGSHLRPDAVEEKIEKLLKD